jgi:AhpD family alkylhydroperoxidase
MIIGLKKLLVSVPPKATKKRKPGTKAGSATTDVYWEPVLVDLVWLRVAQMHGCQWCAQDHAKKLQARGEKDQRLCRLESWRDETIFSLREKAALNLTEAITCNPVSSVPSEAVHAALLFFKESEVLCLILAILAANDWHFLKGFQDGNRTGRPPHE